MHRLRAPGRKRLALRGGLLLGRQTVHQIRSNAPPEPIMQFVALRLDAWRLALFPKRVDVVGEQTGARFTVRSTYASDIIVKSILLFGPGHYATPVPGAFNGSQIFHHSALP
jgi:hypothetical protein